jgi:hypothetical protein
MVAFGIGLYLAFGSPATDTVHTIGILLCVWELAWFLAGLFRELNKR